MFIAATRGMPWVQYTPKEVATQVVAGLNYRFRCDARAVAPDATTYTAFI